MKNPKVVGKCPTCSRDIEQGDDVKFVKSTLYHEECAPEEDAKPQPQEQPKEKAVKPKKEDTMAQLIALVGDLAKQVADLKAQRVAPAAPKRDHKKGEPRPNVWYEIKGYPNENFPLQCLRVMRCIAQATPEDRKMTETQIWEALMGEDSKLGPWSYRQDPFYIFKYYRAKMIDGEYVRGPFNL